MDAHGRLLTAESRSIAGIIALGVNKEGSFVRSLSSRIFVCIEDSFQHYQPVVS